MDTGNCYIVKRNKNQYIQACRYLVRGGYKEISLSDTAELSLKSKKELVKDGVKHAAKIFALIPRLRNCEKMLTIGNVETLILLLFNRLHLINPKQIFWWGFFIHDAKSITIMRYFMKFLYRDNLKIILFSQCEIDLYSNSLGLKREMFEYVPYGNWNDEEIESEPVSEQLDYFFAGGYSNRNYELLLESWSQNKIDEQLVVIGSKNNRDLVNFYESKISDYGNIKILFDATSEEFDKYLSKAKAVVFPFRDNTGASGQSVALRCMRQNKLMISSATDIMQEYVIDGKTGFILKDFKEELCTVIDEVNSNAELVDQMLSEQKKLYLSKFSYKAVTKKLDLVLSQ